MDNHHPNIPVVRLRDILMVTMPPDPDDSTVSALQERVLSAMERDVPKGVILDISSVQTLDSYFVRTVTETAKMVTLMGGHTIIAGMHPLVAMAAVQMGLTLPNIATALTVDHALDRYESEKK